MEKILMHGNDEVVRFSQGADGANVKIKEIKNEILLPDKTPSPEIALQRWIMLRKRATFVGKLAEARNFYGEAPFRTPTLRSMTDSYWIKEEGDTREWEEVDPREDWDPEFDSIFLMIYDPSNLETMDEDSPNMTIIGEPSEIWGEVQGELVILNEEAQLDVGKYRIAKNMDLRIVSPRFYVIKKGFVFSYRTLDIDEETERIPLDCYYNLYSDPNLSKEENISRTFSSIGISGWRDYISEMIKYDKACDNKTRDLSSLGIIRNIKTLECVKIDRL